MIHLDANYLILGNQEGSLEDAALRGWLEADRTLGTSAIAWLEFVSGPGSAPTGEAELAAKLFNAVERRRALRYDCMIAAAAITAGAELATRNVADFRLFAPHGLILAI